MTRPIADLDVPLPRVQEQMRELVARQREAVAELPPITWRPQDKTPKSTAEEAQR